MGPPQQQQQQQRRRTAASSSTRLNLLPLLQRSLLLITLAYLLLQQAPAAYAQGLHRFAGGGGGSFDDQGSNTRADARTLVGRPTALSLHQEMQILLSMKASILQYNPGKATDSVLESWDSASSSDPCKWSGVQCGQGPEGLHVTGLDLSNNNFGGNLPLGLGNLTYISSVSLALNSFVGTIPADIADCYNLESLDLSSNQLYGAIPAGLGGLLSLATLNISFNNLIGGIPEELFSAGCSNLQMVNLSSNDALGGELPSSVKNCKSLAVLDVSNCSLVGGIPEELGRLPVLSELVLRGNALTGGIPVELFAHCQNLRTLDLALNNLTGDLPAQIQNCSQLQNLALSTNGIRSIPREIGGLINLERLLISQNWLTELPEELGGCTGLRVLVVSGNSLAGEIPGFIAKLTNLQFLSLYSNGFTGSIPSWLGSLKSLRHLDASANALTGSIPVELASIEPIQFLLLSTNKLSGLIPEKIGDMVNLQVLDLSSNMLTGSIPPSLGRLQRLLWLMLANNRLEGELPPQLGNCSSLLWLNAAINRLSGQLPDTLASIGNNVDATFALNIRSLPLIPKAMGECNAVKRWIPSHYPPFDLISNIMTVERCRNFWNLLMRGVFMYPLCPSRPAPESMGYIQLSQNRFTGPIPASLSRCGHLGLLFLDQNNLTGHIPDNLAGLALTGLNVSRNGLSGYVPRSIGALTCLVSLDLSFNNLSGRIPSELQNLTKLNRFNISYNAELVGPIPTGQQFSTFGPSIYEGDYKLCISSTSMSSSSLNESSSSASRIPSCGASDGGPGESGLLSSRTPSQPTGFAIATVVGISLACTLGLIVLVLLGVCLLGKAPPAASMDFMMVGGKEHRHFGPDAAASVQVSLFSVELPKQLTYSDLVSATSNFDECNVVGSGGFGVVYKAKLSDGSTVAIKKLIQEGPQADREFLAEMETLGHLHHDNLVPLLGCSSCGTQKLLVYKYMENGSLDDWLHERPGGAEALEWPIRLNIALGIARGLKFLHHNCSPPVVHRDMKASNILLDEHFEPRLTDFGLARVLGAQDTHVSTVVAGTLGYVPPEYCQTWRATAKGDVYSFGVVLLELVTGRRPMSICFGEKDCGNLIEWAAYHVKKGIPAEVCDPIVVRSAAPGELLAFLSLAVGCTAELPIRRPTMREVLKVLEEIKAGNYSAVAQQQQQQR